VTPSNTIAGGRSNKRGGCHRWTGVARRSRRRLVEDREQLLGRRLAGRPGVVPPGERSQRQEELGRDDQDGERAIERQRAGHQPEADLDGDEGHRDGARPVQHEPRLERAPQHLQRRLAVAPADRPHVLDLLGAPPEHLQRRDAAQHVEEVAAHPAQLGEPPLTHRPGPAADEREEQHEHGAGRHEDERGKRVDEHHDDEHEQRDDRGEVPRRLVGRQPGVDRLQPGAERGRQLAAPLRAEAGRTELPEVPGHVRPKPALQMGRATLGHGLGREHAAAAGKGKPHERGHQHPVARGRPAIDDDRGDDEAEQPGRRDHADGAREAHPDGQPQQAPGGGHAGEERRSGVRGRRAAASIVSRSSVAAVALAVA
jgi:hypothetical protein